MKILYVSQYFPPEMGAPAARAVELARHWVRAGHDVTVLTGFPNHPTGVVPEQWRPRLRNLVYREDVEGIRVVRTWLLPLPNRKAHERMLNYGSFCVSAAWRGMELSRPDVVIATSPQLLVGLSGWSISFWKRVPFIFEVRDLWPESLSAVGVGSDNSLLHCVLGKIAGFLYRKADRVVVVTPAFKDHLMNHWQLPGDKISIVENGVESSLFAPEAAEAALKEQLGLKDKFVAAYIGTMGMAHGLDTLIDVASKLKQSDPDISLLLVGEGADKERVQAIARERQLSNITFVGQQPREKIPAFIGASDVCLVLLKKTELFKTVIPTKMLEFMSCAKPVILGVDGQARQILDEAHAGITIEPENAVALADAIRRLKADPTAGRAFGQSARAYIVERCSREQSAKQYVRVLQEVLKRST
ncbi:MAG TPA: glycosyltransferase family 4 protein [Terriglobales bacterium]|nr:glycosyltransferase family 4 protein [Terriglobales bacterium]